MLLPALPVLNAFLAVFIAALINTAHKKLNRHSRHKPGPPLRHGQCERFKNCYGHTRHECASKEFYTYRFHLK